RQQPRERDLPGACAVAARELGERAIGPRRLAGREREPWDEGDRALRAGVEHRLAVAVERAVAVLDRHDLGDPQRLLELGGRDVREADVADLSGLLRLDQRAERVLEWHGGVGPVELVEVDPLDRQAAKAP